MSLGVRGLGVATRILYLAARPEMEGPAMSDRSSETPLTRNLILDALGTYERAMLLAAAETRPIKVGTTLFRPGDTIGLRRLPDERHAVLIAQPDRAMPVEAATIGREGIAIPHAPLGSRISTRSSSVRSTARW